MSKVFSSTSTRDGLIQGIERNCGFNDGDISGNTVRLAQFTGDINSSVDVVFGKIFGVGGTWQFDDSNHTDYPIITTNLVLDQRDYAFTADANSNLILEIYRVLASDSNGNFRELLPVDAQSSNAPSNYTDGLNVKGQPNTYDKTGNGIFLDPIPNYARTAGLKVFINREGSYFTVADTSKKPGIAGLFHDYYALRPSYMYCLDNQIKIKGDLKNEMLEMEEAIKNYYKAREKDNPKRLTVATNNSR